MQSKLDLTAFERSLWLARGDMEIGTGHAFFVWPFLGEAIRLLNLGGLPVLELTEPTTPGLVNTGWQFYFGRRLPMVRDHAALVVQPVTDWNMRRSLALVAAIDDDRMNVVLEFGEPEPELATARHHILVGGAMMPAKPGDVAKPVWTPDIVEAVESGSEEETLAVAHERARHAANRAVGAIWAHSVSEFEVAMPSTAEILAARDRNRTPPQRPHAICGALDLRLPQFPT